MNIMVQGDDTTPVAEPASMLGLVSASPDSSGCDPPLPAGRMGGRLARSTPLAPRLSTESDAEPALAPAANGSDSHLLIFGEEPEVQAPPAIRAPPPEEDMEPNGGRADDVSLAGPGTNRYLPSFMCGLCRWWGGL